MTIATLVLALVALAHPDQHGQAGSGSSSSTSSTARQDSSALLLLDFTATWCGPCRMVKPEVEKLSASGYPVRAVDIDESPDLAERYQVKSVPTFIVVDDQGRALARTEGYRPAAEIAELYRTAQTKLATVARTEAAPARPIRNVSTQGDEDEDQATPAGNPRPWETVVRIRIRGSGTIGFGSGTIISSTPEETIILTCAHIFKIEGQRTQPHPKRFPRPIEIDLFDGRLHGGDRPQVHYSNETIAGEAIDYDFSRDVGLIRIRPGRILPASPVVPPRWAAQARMKMITVGCSEGHDATPWTTTVVRPQSNLRIHPGYEAIECQHAPKQGRSGGGLYTLDGYVAGVCDFAEPESNRGLYATPASIHVLLDRNDLSHLYRRDNPNKPPVYFAGASKSRTNETAPARTIARAQSPDGEEPKVVSLPSPELLGVPNPPHDGWKTAANRTGASPAPETRTATRNSAHPGGVLTADLISENPSSAGAAGRIAPVPTAPRPAAEEPERTVDGWRSVKSKGLGVTTTSDR